MKVVFDRAQGAGALKECRPPDMLSLLDRAPRRLVPAAPHYRTIGLNNLGVGQLWAGDLADANDSLGTARIQCQGAGDGAGRDVRPGPSIGPAVDSGQLRTAYDEAGGALQVVDRRGWGGEPQALGLYVALGMTLLAWDRLDDAADLVAAGLAASSTGSDTSCRLALGITAVGIAMARGDAAAARSAAAGLSGELAKIADRPDLLTRWCAVAQAQARLIAGDPRRCGRLHPRSQPTTTSVSPPPWNGSFSPRLSSRSVGPNC